MGDNGGGHSPPATASSWEKGGKALGDESRFPVEGGNGGTLNMGLITDFADLGVWPLLGG